MSDSYSGAGRGVAGRYLEQRRVAYDLWKQDHTTGHAGDFKNSIAAQEIAFLNSESHSKWVSNHMAFLQRQPGAVPKQKKPRAIITKVGLEAACAIGITVAGEYGAVVTTKLGT
jgi:hypothetical protein